MNCPVCNLNLVITDRQGVEIDYCPKCRGVWLDRGELDKLIERSASASQSYYQQDDDDDRHRHSSHDSHQYSHDKHLHGKHKPKRESFLSDIFDFD